nr:unnamed protein product [Digitaria exilis]
MAAKGGGEERPARRFQCLAVLRYMVATVVTVLALVVIAKVIAVGVRPKDIVLSVVHGHVWTSALWKEVTTPPKQQRGGDNNNNNNNCTGGDDGDCSSDSGGLPATKATYQPVAILHLKFVMSVDNPSGRGSVHCDSISVAFIGGGGGGGDDDTMTIGTIPLPYSFQVRPQSTHKFFRLVTIYNTTVLAHMASEYAGMTSFTGRLQVTMNTYDTRLGRRADSRTAVGFECSPVVFSLADASDTDASIQCLPAGGTRSSPGFFNISIY